MPAPTLLFLGLACADPAPVASSALAGTLVLGTSAWEPGEAIPVRFTCEGEDLAPPLAWRGVPEGTKSLALVVEDPDAPDPAAPRTTWTHWILYDLPAAEGAMPEGHPALPTGAREGRNGWGEAGYRGPCPPIGRHRYFHRLFALDVVLPDLGTPDRAALLAAMQGHVLAQAELLGTYEKAGSER